MSDKTLSPYTVAVIGGGQLARMMQEAANALGITLRALVEAPDVSTAQVVPQSIVGQPKDVERVRELVEGADVLTFEHEHIPPQILAELEPKMSVQPCASALECARDKVVMRRRLTKAGIPCPQWKLAHSVDDMDGIAQELGGYPLIAKTPRGGYDGHGVMKVNKATDIAPWLEDFDEILIEQLVPFTREIAVLLARSPSGEIRHWDVAETIQSGGMCSQVIAPAQHMDPQLMQKAQTIGTRIAQTLNVTGVLAVEMFVVGEDDDTQTPAVYVNELAMRPHNSGHWTIDGARTSQFEQHLRAVLDLPLGQTTATAPVTVMVNLLGGEGDSDPRLRYPEVMKSFPDAKIHYYGKGVRPRRKLGHVCMSGTDATQLLADATKAVDILRDGVGGKND